MIRILAQRALLVDKAGKMSPDWFAFFADWVKSYNRRQALASSTSYDAVTGTTDATIANSETVSIGASGMARLALSVSCTANANAKSVIVRIGGEDACVLSVSSGAAYASVDILIAGRGASGGQYCAPVSLVNGTASPLSTAADLSGNTTIDILLQLGSSTDTISLESWALTVEQA